MLLGVDVGGTFTDAVLVADGALYTAKVPSTPAAQSRGVLEAVRVVLARAGVKPAQVERFAHGMTVATNALLEGEAARTALIATEGFEDVVELGRQARPKLYELCVAAPPPFAPPELRFGAPERMGPDGPLRALDPGAARALVRRVAAARPRAVAVALLHSYAHPSHERLLGELLAELLPGVHVSLSHDLVGTFREYERAATTEVDAALSPLLGTYLRRLSADARAEGLPEPQIVSSAGGLLDCSRAAAHAALTVLSGPAGGVGGALLLAELAGVSDLLCFDMGGTSCDVCLIEGSVVAETSERAVAGRPLALPALDILTVGAGGGSIAWRDQGGALRVGPASAGADPGPACYGRGGTRPTVTDANLLLGHLPADAPLAHGLLLDRDAAERAIAGLARELGLETMRCAEGIVRVAEAEMARALRVMSVERGVDPRRLVLLPFGGAGPLHAAALAEALSIERILCPRSSGVLSALGLAAAAPRRDAARTVMLRGEELSAERLAREREALLAQARAALGGPCARVRVRHELRYRGQSFELPVDEELGPEGSCEGRARGGLDPDALRGEFARVHEQRYGYRDDAEVELVTLRACAWGPAPELRLQGAGAHERIEGPAVHPLPEATLYVPAGWAGEVDEWGTVRLRRGGNRAEGADR
jgi:N-methylhydantoinase A